MKWINLFFVLLISTLGTMSCGSIPKYKQKKLHNEIGTVVNYANCDGCYQYVIDIPTEGIIWHLFDPQLPAHLKKDGATIQFDADVIEGQFQSVKRARENKSLEHLFNAQVIKVIKGKIIEK